MEDDIRIQRAARADAEEVLALIKRAFGPVAVQYGDENLPPLIESLEAHRARYATHVILKALDGAGRIVGSVQAVTHGDTCLVGRLVVDPAVQRRGIGRALAVEIERHFPHVRRFELFTGSLSTETLQLYNSLGYHELKREQPPGQPVLVFMEKARDEE